MRLPKPLRYAAEEGGEWIEWDNRRFTCWHPNFGPRGIVAHTIVFDNGRAFDMVSGWRENMRYDKKTGERIT